jgi:eukaryotic-like serine/threonine-protein kinase
MVQEHTRRLAAVWFADISGYTALSGRDEDAALEVVAELQALSTTHVESHGGRIVKFIGDAVLATFESTDSAIRTALELQTAFRASDVVGLHGTAICIAVHVGEIAEAADGDVYGDGVNVASRIQSVAKAGTVVASDSAARLVDNRSDFVVRSVGTHQFKGVKRPVEVFIISEQIEQETLDTEPSSAPLAMTTERFAAALSGRYAIERELGEGGMATVYLADDLKHNRKVAVKVLKPQLAAVIGAERFLAEIKTTANLQHPNILPLFDSGQADFFVFYVMPYVEGESLREKLDREHQLPVDEAVRLATDIAEALGAAHENGIVHRDIKPANILLSRGRPLVADFGIALAANAAGSSRLTETGLSVGTPQYMSPEQTTGESHIDARSDIYSLAAMLYEMLAGEPPYSGRTAQVVMAKRLTQPVPSVRHIRNRVPESVDAAIQRALAPLPADRFATTSEFTAELTSLVATGPRGPKEPRRWKPWAAAGVAAALVMSIGVALGKLGGSGSVDESLRRISVLPFDNLSEDTERAFISAGLTEEITSQLGKIAAFQVLSTTSVQRLMAAGRTLDELGEEFGLGWVVEGSVREAGDQLRVTARLIDVHTEENVWSDDYDGVLADIFDVQRTIAVEIAAALDATLSPDEARRIDKRPTENLAAYALFERARGMSNAPDQIDLKTQMLEAVIEMDSTFAGAYAWLGRTHMWRTFVTGERSWIESAEALARTAIRLDSDSEFAYTVLGDILGIQQGRWGESKIAFLRAIELNPSHTLSMQDLSVTLIQLGSYDESLYWAERAFASRVRTYQEYFHVAWPLVLLVAEQQADQFLARATEQFPEKERLERMWMLLDVNRRRYESATQRARQLFERFPNSLEAAEVLFLLRSDDAGAALESLYRRAPDQRFGLIVRTVRTTYAYTLWDAGLRERAEVLFDESVAFSVQALAEGDEGFGFPYELASIAAVRGRADEALDLLEQAYGAGLRWAMLLELDPMLDTLREEPRFVDLLARMHRDVATMRAAALSPDGLSMFRDSLSGGS